MMTAQDIREMNDLSTLLASGLLLDDHNTGLPLEVSQALAEAREQMAGLPEVIENLNLAFERFHTVSSALGRMIELADEASGAEMDDETRRSLNREFGNLAKILAADAGRQYYAGPRLNLLNQGEALSAARIIRYMNPVIDNMGQELTGQRDLIHEVLGETINFLGVVTQCYPDSEGAARLGDLISQAAARGRLTTTSAPQARLH